MGPLEKPITSLWMIVLSSLAAAYVLSAVRPVVEHTVFAVGSLLRTGTL